MPLNLDAYLGVHQDALTLYARRTEVLADNLANADTPNYKARDVDFRAALARAGGGGAPGTAPALPLATPSAGQIGGGAAPAAAPDDLKYRVPLAPSLDGNTVDPQLEQAAFADNAVRYQAALTFLNSEFKDLTTAITGQ
jgi:flagellar basal-body rod protein FlgB